MANLGDRFRDLGTLDALGTHGTSVHRIDPRAKVIVTAAFTLTVASFGRYEVSALLPFTVFPMALAILGEVPFPYVFKRVLLALPFVAMLGILNPFLDRAPALQIGSFILVAGWLSYASMVLRLVLGVAAVVVLVATTGLDRVCEALEHLGVPKIFVLQISFLHRYSFVLAEEAGRMLRARELRANGRRLTMKEFPPLSGHLLLRTWDRARRIHLAMLARGFEGDFHSRQPLRFTKRDVTFLVGWCGMFAWLRWVHLAQWMGWMFNGGSP